MSPVLDLKNNQYTDDAYLKSIEQYKSNDALYKSLLTNPWMRSKNAEFSPNFWQGLLRDLFDDDSFEANYYQNLLSNQNQWMSDKVEAFRQQDYDSASAQANRLAEAGINPDLNGSVSAGAAAENDQPSLPSPSMGGDSGSSVASIGRGAMSFLSFILSGAKTLQELNLGEESFVASELSNNVNALNYVLNSRGLSSKYSNYTPAQLDAVSDDEIIAAVKEAKFPGYSKRTQKYLKRFMNTLTPDSLAVQDIRERLMAQIAESRQRRVQVEGSPTYSKDFEKWVKDYADKMANVEFETWKVQQRAEKEHWSLKYTEAKLGKIQTDAQYDLYNFVRGGNKWYNTLGLLGLPILGDALGTTVNTGINFLSQKGLKRIPSMVLSGKL